MTRIGALGLAMVALGASASLAIAAPPAGKGKPDVTGASKSGTTTESPGVTKGKKPVTGEGCRPRVTVILKGELVGAPGEAGTSLTLAVTRTNAHGRAFLAGAQPLSVAIGPDTRVTRRGTTTQASLLSGDRLLVQARICKADLKTDALPPLTAQRVIAHPTTAT